MEIALVEAEEGNDGAIAAERLGGLEDYASVVRKCSGAVEAEAPHSRPTVVNPVAWSFDSDSDVRRGSCHLVIYELQVEHIIVIQGLDRIAHNILDGENVVSIAAKAPAELHSPPGIIDTATAGFGL